MGEEVEQCLTPCVDSERVARGRTLALPDETYSSIADIFRALADSTRVKIIYHLLQQDLCTCDLAAITGNSESSVSQHLRMLRHLRLVKNYRRGKLVFYQLDDAHISLLLAVCLGHVRDGDVEHEQLAPLMSHFTRGGRR